MAIPYLTCMALVAHLYHLPLRVLPSIQAVEGGAVGSVSRNTNGTEDLGVMQVNTIWIGPLSRLTGLPEPLVRVRLTQNACFNIAAAGAILRAYLDESRGDLLRAIGNYHSHTPVLHDRYRVLVENSARRLFQTR